MSIQPIVGLPGVYPAKLSLRREIFLHPDRVSYRYSGRFLHKHAKDWESPESPNTLKAGTILALAELRFPGETQSKLYWFPFILTLNHLSTTNKILLPASFNQYSYMFTGPCRWTRFQIVGATPSIRYTNVISNATVNTTDTHLEINFSNTWGIDSEWADNSALVFWGLDGPIADQNPFDYVRALSVLPGDTLVSDTHIQLHHYPWSGIVKGDMLYPKFTLTGVSSGAKYVIKKVLRDAAAAGLTGLLVDETTF